VLSKQVVYVLEFFSEGAHVSFDFLGILSADDDSLDELCNLNHLILLHAQASYRWGPNAQTSRILVVSSRLDIARYQLSVEDYVR